MYALPQEIEVWYIIPAIRKALAEQLVKKHKLTLEKTGNILGVSKAAVSQYLSKKRATKITFPEKIKQEVKQAAKKIIKNPETAVKEILSILTLIKKTKCSCQACKLYNKGILKICKMKPSLTGETK